MKTAEEFLDEYSTTLTDGTKICPYNMRVKAMKAYGAHCINEALIVASEYAKTKIVKPVESDKILSIIVDPDSILGLYSHPDLIIK